MTIITSFENLAGLPASIHWAMGVFDGIHLGHQLIIASARQSKTNQGGLLGVFTFDRHPMTVTRPDMAPPGIITGSDEKYVLLERLGVDVVLALPFDETVSSLSPTRFLDLLGAYRPIGSISVGSDWKFGKERQGNVKLLEEEGKKRGFSAYVHPHIIWNGERISSTRIREHIRKGDMAGAGEMLGRPYSLSGIVTRGKQLGRQLGFPTANIPLTGEFLPPFGVYAVNVARGQETVHGIANLGARPTIDNDTHETLLEVHLFNWQGDLYGEPLQVELMQFLRPEKKFASIEELKTQIESDCLKARNALAGQE